MAALRSAWLGSAVKMSLPRLPMRVESVCTCVRVGARARTRARVRVGVGVRTRVRVRVKVRVRVRVRARARASLAQPVVGEALGLVALEARHLRREVREKLEAAQQRRELLVGVITR